MPTFCQLSPVFCVDANLLPTLFYVVCVENYVFANFFSKIQIQIQKSNTTYRFSKKSWQKRNFPHKQRKIKLAEDWHPHKIGTKVGKKLA